MTYRAGFNHSNGKSLSWEEEEALAGPSLEEERSSGSSVAKKIAWIAVGAGVAVAAVYAGIKLRTHYSRPKSPYETFGYAGDDGTDYGVGI